MSDEVPERRRIDDRRHEENSKKLDTLVSGQATTNTTLALMALQIADIYGTEHKTGRMEKLEDRVDDLESAKDSIVTLRWVFGAIVAFLGIDKIQHWFTGK